ncbi:MAG TPA: hypothetical protein DCL24_04175 [Erysipelotrichaceae bacterium]|nr:hypothetical protein [Erysipelotrichaceae bacterium]HBG85082.1 hypothetical protein [Erysipelotrichaceae bacterium]HBZ51455.1 hypothetical protein [Erysipelotrichaceae bacterium]HCJ37180.1 hypothetical protein [Erysipelotrichaceae bacterium]
MQALLSILALIGAAICLYITVKCFMLHSDIEEFHATCSRYLDEIQEVNKELDEAEINMRTLNRTIELTNKIASKINAFLDKFAF